MRFPDICAQDAAVPAEDADLDAAAGEIELYCAAMLPDVSSEEIREFVSLIHYDLYSLFQGLDGEKRVEQANFARNVMLSMRRLSPDQLMHDIRLMVRGEQVEPVMINERITRGDDAEPGMATPA